MAWRVLPEQGWVGGAGNKLHRQRNLFIFTLWRGNHSSPDSGEYCREHIPGAETCGLPGQVALSSSSVGLHEIKWGESSRKPVPSFPLGLQKKLWSKEKWYLWRAEKTWKKITVGMDICLYLSGFLGQSGLQLFSGSALASSLHRSPHLFP